MERSRVDELAVKLPGAESVPSPLVQSHSLGGAISLVGIVTERTSPERVGAETQASAEELGMRLSAPLHVTAQLEGKLVV